MGAALIVHANGLCDSWDCTHEAVDAEEVIQCRAWLRAFASKRQSINTRAGSYFLKHIIEAAVGSYVSNGALIQAAILEGFEVRPIGPRNLNAFFNISLRRAPSAVRSAA